MKQSNNRALKLKTIEASITPLAPYASGNYDVIRVTWQDGPEEIHIYRDGTLIHFIKTNDFNQGKTFVYQNAGGNRKGNMESAQSYYAEFIELIRLSRYITEPSANPVTGLRQNGTVTILSPVENGVRTVVMEDVPRYEADDLIAIFKRMKEEKDYAMALRMEAARLYDRVEYESTVELLA